MGSITDLFNSFTTPWLIYNVDAIPGSDGTRGDTNTECEVKFYMETVIKPKCNSIIVNETQNGEGYGLYTTPLAITGTAPTRRSTSNLAVSQWALKIQSGVYLMAKSVSGKVSLAIGGVVWHFRLMAPQLIIKKSKGWHLT